MTVTDRKTCARCAKQYVAKGSLYNVARRRFCTEKCAETVRRSRAWRRAHPNPRPVGRPRKVASE